MADISNRTRAAVAAALRAYEAAQEGPEHDDGGIVAMKARLEEVETPDALPMTFRAMARELLRNRTDVEIARMFEAECREQGRVAFDAAQASRNKTEGRAMRQRAMDLGTRAAYWNKRSRRKPVSR